MRLQMWDQEEGGAPALIPCAVNWRLPSDIVLEECKNATIGRTVFHCRYPLDDQIITIIHIPTLEARQ